MERRRLGRTEVEVGVMGLGGAGLGDVYGPVTEAEAVAAVHGALDLGVNFIDTAPLYGSSEARLGVALEGRRSEVFLATKTGLLPGMERVLDSDGILRSVEASLARLRVDSVDLLQYHEIEPEIADRVLADDGPLGAMRRLQEEGRARFLGVTGRQLPALAAAVATGAFDTVLTYHECHLIRSQARQALLPVAAEHDVGVINGSPLAAGLLTGEEPFARFADRRGEPDTQAAQRLWKRARAAGVNLPALALQFGLRDPRLTVQIPGAKTLAEVAANVAALEVVFPDSLWREAAEAAAG